MATRHDGVPPSDSAGANGHDGVPSSDSAMATRHDGVPPSPCEASHGSGGVPRSSFEASHDGGGVPRSLLEALHDTGGVLQSLVGAPHDGGGVQHAGRPVATSSCEHRRRVGTAALRPPLVRARSCQAPRPRKTKKSPAPMLFFAARKETREAQANSYKDFVDEYELAADRLLGPSWGWNRDSRRCCPEPGT